MLTQKNRREKDFYCGDTWPYWIGPTLPQTDTNARAIAELQRVFQRANKVRECCDRAVNSLVSRPFRWSLVDASGGKADNSEAELLLKNWLQHTDEQALSLRSATSSPVWTAVRDLIVHGRGYLRLWMPQRLAQKSEAYQRYLMSHVGIGAVATEYDEEGFPIEYRIDKFGSTEIQRLDAAGLLTVEDGDRKSGYNLGGHWLIFELRGESAITQDVIDAQNAINLARTMEARSLIQGGFVERVLLNAQQPGAWVADPSSPTGERFEPAPNGLTLGPGQTAFIQGNPIYDETGQIKNYTQPSINYKDPASGDNYAQSISRSIELIYLAFGQGHLLASDVQLAGVSREQLRKDSELRAAQYERSIVSAIEAALTVMLRLFGHEDLLAVVDLAKADQIVSAEESKAIIDQYNAGLLSRYSAIAALGRAADADAEIELIDQETKDQAKNAPTILPPDPANPPTLDKPSPDPTAG